MYYIFVENGKINGSGECECLTEGVKNIEVTEKIYNDFIEDNDRYIYQDGEIIPNPDYEEIKREQERQAKNKEIDSKIKELREMSLIDIMNNNKENIQIYNDVISGLEMSRP